MTRRMLLAVLIVTLASVAVLAQNPTPFLQLNRQYTGQINYGASVNANWSSLDTKLKCYGIATVPGTISYFDGNTWQCFAGNTVGSKVMTEDASGNLSWATGGGGGGGTPGGSNGNLQYNNVGAFGGLANLPISYLNSGTGASSATFWRGDATWATPPGTISGLTTGFFTKAASATTIANTLCDEAITTANTITCTNTNGIAIPKFTGLSAVILGATSGSAPITASTTGGTLNLGSTNATVDSSGNYKGAGIATGTATVPAFNGANFPYIAAPSTPAASLDSIYVDSTDLRLHDKNASGTIGTTVVASDCGAGSGIRAFSAAGVATCFTPSGSGTVTTSGSPSSGNLTKFSSGTAITNGDLSGDATTTGTLVVTLAAPFKKRSCEIVWGGTGTSNALASGDDAIANQSCFNKLGVTETITAIYCRSDAGSNTTTVHPTFGASGTGTTILSGALTCGSSGAYSSTGTVSNGALVDGANINPVQGGTLTGTSIHLLIVYTVPNS